MIIYLLINVLYCSLDDAVIERLAWRLAVECIGVLGWLQHATVSLLVSRVLA